MKKFIIIAISSLMFIASANAGTLTSDDLPVADIMLICWADYPDVGDAKKEIASIIISPDNDIATMIDPHNDMITGDLTVSEYFYTITINQSTSLGKIGVIKINRLSGVLSVIWTDPKTESRPFPQVDAKYGDCALVDRKQLF